MDADPDDGDAGRPDLRAALEAERAAVDHWRRIALRRSEEYAAVERRPSVRVLLAAERRLGTAVARAASSGRRLRSGLARVALSAGALRRIGRRRPPAPPATTAAMAVAPSERRMALVVVGPTEGGAESAPRPGIEVAHVAEPGAARAALARCIATSSPELVGVVAATTEPQDTVWLDRLAAAVDGSAVAATPLALHPHRPLHRATAHDGLINAAGVRLRLDREGAPVAERVAAGTTPPLDVGSIDVDAGSGAALLVDRAAYEAAGGLAAAADDLDVAVVELCARLRSQAGRVVMVPSAVVVNHGRVRARRELRFAVDPVGPAWAAAIGRSGAVLRRAADPRECPPLRVAVTVAAPSAKVADRWGDWHLAQALASSLRRQGVEARVQTADHADDLAGRACDVHLVLRGLQPVPRTAGQRHVLWIISHPESVDDDELRVADLVLVASPRFAEDLQLRTDTPVEVMLQATDHRRFRPRPPDPGHRHDVTIVAKTRDVLRPVVADAITAGLRPRIYGGGWRAFVDPELVVADHVDNATLPVVYSSAGVVLNDHWRTMRSWGFVSNRLFDVLACGVPVISDHVEGVDDLFDGAVLSYGTPEELRALVDEVLADPVGARERAERGREVVLARHTFDHRACQLIDSLGRCTQDQTRNGT
jgi:Glycosyl transferases group 1